MIGKCNMYVIMCLFFSEMHRQNAGIWRDSAEICHGNRQGQSMIEPSFKLPLWVREFQLYTTSFIIHDKDDNDTETY